MNPAWHHADESDQWAYHLISVLFTKHPKLIAWLFHPTKPQLQSKPEDILIAARSFSSGEQLLVRLALDLWSFSGNAKVMDLVYKLDSWNFQNALTVLQFLQSRSTDLSGFDEYHAHLDCTHDPRLPKATDGQIDF